MNIKTIGRRERGEGERKRRGGGGERGRKEGKKKKEEIRKRNTCSKKHVAAANVRSLNCLLPPLPPFSILTQLLKAALLAYMSTRGKKGEGGRGKA